MYGKVGAPANDSILNETYALFSLYRSVPGYPRGFRKNETPDWIVPGGNGSDVHRLGLEVTIAADEGYFEYYGYTKSPLKLSDVLERNHSHPGVMHLCKRIDGRMLWIEYLPREKLVRKLEWPPRQGYRHLYDLPEAYRELLLDFDVVMIHADSPRYEPTWDHRDCGYFNHMAWPEIREAFGEKLRKLNDGYDACDENHLCIVCPDVLSSTPRALQKFLRHACDSQAASERRFDRAFLVMSDCVVDFDLREELIEPYDHGWTRNDTYALMLGLGEMSDDDKFDPDALYDRLHCIDISGIIRPSTAEVLVKGAGLTKDVLDTDIATLIQREQEKKYGYHWFVDDRDESAS